MVTDALVEADIAWNRRLSNAAMDPESYQGLTDSVLRTIEFAPNEDGHLDKAKSIVKRIRKRNLYVFCFIFPPTSIVYDETHTQIRVRGRNLDSSIHRTSTQKSHR